jgi:arsenite methyltransferase
VADSLRLQGRQLARRRGDYGFDAPYVPIILGSIGVCMLIIGALSAWFFHALVPGIIFLACGTLILLSTAGYIYTTRWGKFQVWGELLSQLQLEGSECVLDMGCGRGAVLLMAADHLPGGKATGIDLWKTNDQSGNARSVTQHNAELEGVAERIELQTADMQSLPFADEAFDVVLSSLAIHNIPAAEGRRQAIHEAVRVLKPGGKLAIADIRETQRYAEYLRELGMMEVTHQILDWRFWYGGPWVATKLVSARKPPL